MKLDPHANLIIVEVEVFKGSKSRIVRMAPDTGATWVMVPWRVAEALDAASLAEAVLQTAADPTGLQAASRALATQTSWPRIAAAHVEIYKRLLYSDQ